MGILLSRCRRPSRWSCVVPFVARVQFAGGQTGVPATKRISRCPDVIEAHEKYERGPSPVADVWTRISRPPPPPPQKKLPFLDQKPPERRKLPTQHHHPLNTLSARLYRTEIQPPSVSAVSNNELRAPTRPTAPDVLSTFEKSHNSSCFGYDIRDVDAFLAEASFERPANIPMVLCRAAPLFRWPEASAGVTQKSSPPPQLMLPLGMVVNGVFRQNSWLYAQTPHGHEGFIRYAASLPLGILPSSQQSSSKSAATLPCWESASDVFPEPRGYSAAGRIPTGSRSERGYCEDKRPRRVRRSGASDAEKGLDKLYLRALQQRCGPSLPVKPIQHDFGFV